MTNKVWRPTKLSESIVWKLYEAFKLWWTVEEACCYAEISRATYYEWIKENDEFSDKIWLAKKYLEIKSRAVISNSIEAWDIKTAMWYLERKNKSEFSIKEILSQELKENSLKEILEEIQSDKDILNDYQKNTIIERAKIRKLENPMENETTERLIEFVIN